MKELIFILFFIFPQAAAFAQIPSNDPCSNPMVLYPGTEVCGESLDNATTQSVAGERYSDCTTSGTERSLWYTFTAINDSMTLSLYDTSSEVITNSYWDCTVYHTTTCFPKYSGIGGTGVICVEANDVNNNDKAIVVNMTTLIVGDGYLVQVTYKPGNSNAPDYCITLGSTTNCGTCTYPCGAACVYPSYVPTQSQVTATCTPYKPSPALEGTQTTTQCYTFTADKSQMNCGLILHDPQTSLVCTGESWNWTLYNSTCGPSVATGSFTHSSTATTAAATSTLMNYTLTIGQSYTICYTVTTSSSCLASSFYPYLYPNFILPIQLVSFAGYQVNDYIALDWSTASELNNDYFVVQRSNDGEGFTDLTTIDGHGTSTSPHSYSYNDHEAKTGINYYRLKQVDVASSSVILQSDNDTSTIHYSPTIAVTYDTPKLYQFELTPGYADIQLLQSTPCYVIVFDESGRIVYQTVDSGPTTIKISTGDKQGIWYACLIQGNHKELIAAF